jgi:hypothetical protein
MEEKLCNSVPFAVYESAMTRAERNFKRMWILIIILLALFVGTNAAWIWHESQFETVESWEITQETEDGNNSYIGNDGDIIYGETDNKKDQDPET